MNSVRRNLLAILVMFGISVNAHTQLWQSLNGGLDRSAHGLFADTSSNFLYVGGDFSIAGGVAVCGIAVWNGTNWSKVGTEPQDTICPYTSTTVISVAKFGNDLFASGGFSFSGSSATYYLIRWDGLGWDSSSHTNAGGLFEIVNGELLGMGFMNNVNGTKVGRIVRWNVAGHWESFGDSLAFTDPSWWVQSGAYYQGRYFFGGNFSTWDSIAEIASWDGTSWSSLGHGILGDAWVNKLMVYKGLLFVGGEFYAQDGNPSSYLATWDGVHWGNPFPDVAFTSQVRDMQVIDERLYILGTHYAWDGGGWTGPFQLAHYDGVDFCSFGGMDIFPRDIAGVNGRTYVTTTTTSQTDPYNGIAEWIGGDSVDICISQPVGRPEPVVGGAQVSLFPNPAAHGFSLKFREGSVHSANLLVMDVQGREVLPEFIYREGDPPVDVSMLPAGVYVVQVRTRTRVENIKLVVN